MTASVSSAASDRRVGRMLALKKLLQHFVVFGLRGKPQAVGHLRGFRCHVGSIWYFSIRAAMHSLDGFAIDIRQGLVDGVNAYRLSGQINDGFKKG